MKLLCTGATTLVERLLLVRCERGISNCCRNITYYIPDLEIKTVHELVIWLRPLVLQVRELLNILLIGLQVGVDGKVLGSERKLTIVGNECI